MFASVPMLAYGVLDYDFEVIRIIFLCIITLYSGFFSTLLWNDITDIEIDKIAHPNRPLPMGKISTKNMFIIALFFSALTFLGSFLISFWCFIFVLFSAFFVAVHNKYLKKIIKLPAYSEVFTPLQWTIVPIFGFLAIWTGIAESSFNYQSLGLLILFTYLADAGHDLPEGISDLKGDRVYGVKTYATTFGKKNAAKISFVMFLISGILGFSLSLVTSLSILFIILFSIVWLYAIYQSYSLLISNEINMEKLGRTVGQKTFRYFWLTFDIIFFDLFLQILFFNS